MFHQSLAHTHTFFVLQVAFPAGSMEQAGKADMSYMRELLELIEREQVPAPAPIEQRWTAGSSASLSVAADADPDSVHSWV
jgi:L-galactono-1,4-lactone dehydrogenase